MSGYLFIFVNGCDNWLPSYMYGSMVLMVEFPAHMNGMFDASQVLPTDMTELMTITHTIPKL